MTMHINQDQFGSVLKISGSLEIGAIDILHRALVDCLNRESAPEVDLSEVDACDASALQLLCAARKSAMQSDKPFRVVALSDGAMAAGAALGLPLEELGFDVPAKGAEVDERAV
jgi:anti-anti-sigma regulatory factor